MTVITPFIIHPDADKIRQQNTLLQQCRQLAISYERGDEVVNDIRLQAIGSQLWHALDINDTLDDAKAATGVFPLPLIIESDDSLMFSLPWETLYHPHYGFLAREPGFTLTRRMAKVNTALPAIPCEPLRILLFTSLPDDLSEAERLDTEAEQASVQEILSGAEQAGRIRLEMPDDGRFDTFQTMMAEFEPHLLYLSGHGEFHYDLPGDKAWGSFLFEDEWGNSQPINETELCRCFQGNQTLQAVVLSACQSAKPHPSHIANGLAQVLHQSGIPHVIGMRESVYDKAGILFAEHFFQAISDHKRPADIASALQQARAAISSDDFLGTRRREQHSSPQRQAIANGQWCLPLQLSQQIERPLIDWSFAPVAPDSKTISKIKLNDIDLAANFMGRRRELRRWQNALRKGEVNQLMIIGAGGMGKTALTGKLLQSLQKDGYQAYGLSLREEHDWQATIDTLVDSLDPAQQEVYQQALATASAANKPSGLLGRIKSGMNSLIGHVDQRAKASALLRLLLQQNNNKLVLLIDNLESCQDNNKEINDPALAQWLAVARTLETEGLKLLITSRWQLPDWDNNNLYQLGKPIYTDYIAFARRMELPAAFIADATRLQRAYDVLGGNFRALEFFARAIEQMTLAEESDFLAQLDQAKSEIQTNMAIAKVYAHCSAEAQLLLQRLRVYTHPVDMDGVRTVALKAEPALRLAETLVDELLAFSLLERYSHPRLDYEIQLSPLVRDWLNTLTIASPTQALQQLAAHYQLELWDKDIKVSWAHLLQTHSALADSGLENEANRLALNWIVGRLNRAGRYREIIEQWLPRISHSADPKTRGEALGQLGKQHLHIGDYKTALDFLKQSLAIRQEIGDKSGEGTTLNNISQIFKARGDYETALDFLKQSLAIQQEIGDIQGESVTLNNIARIHHARGNLELALEYQMKDLAIVQEIDDKSGEGTTLNNMATTAHARGDYETALDFLKQSLAIQQEIGDKSGEGTTLNNISQIYDARGDYETALDFLKQSLAIRQEIGDKSGEGTTLNNMATTAHARGDYETALDFLKQSLAIQQEIGDKSGEGTTLNNISQIYDARGDYETALDFLKQSLAIRQEIGDKSGEGTTLNNMATTAHARGDYETALDFLKQSLAIQQEIGDKSGEGTTLNNISQIFKARGDYETTLDFLKQSLAIQQEIGDKSGEGTTLNNISQIFKARGDYETALDFLKQSLAIQQEIGDAAGLCATLFNMGHIHLQNEEPNEAVQAWITVYQLASKMNLAQVLDALEKLAPQIGLEGGLQAWAKLAERFNAE